MASVSDMVERVKNSKLSKEVAKKLELELKNKTITRASVFEIVFCDDSELLKFITEDYLKSQDHQIANVLSVVYDKTMLLNVKAPKCLNVIEAYLVDCQYSRHVNGGVVTMATSKIGDTERLVKINKCVDLILLKETEPFPCYQFNENFFCLLRSLSKHLHLFLLSYKKKNKLKFIIDIKNIEYCLNIFCLIQRDPKHLVRLLVNNLMIVHILKIFKRKPFKTSKSKKDEEFLIQLERDTFNIKNYIAATNIYSYIERVEDIDIEKCPITGPLAIRRTIQVIGEFTKLTHLTPNISPEMSAEVKSLHGCLFRGNTQRIRDQLSHNYSLHRLNHLDNRESFDYKALQNELKNLKAVFKSLILTSSGYIEKHFFDTIFKCESEIGIKSLCMYIEDVEAFDLPDIPYNENISKIMYVIRQDIIPQVSAIENYGRHFKRVTEVLERLTKKVVLTFHYDGKSSFDLNSIKFFMRHRNLADCKRFLKFAGFNFENPLKTSLYIRLIYMSLRTLKALSVGENESLAKSIESILEKIENSFDNLGEIENLRLILDDDKGNIILECENLKYFKEVSSKLGLKELEFKEHEKFPQFEELMATLNEITSSSHTKLNKKFDKKFEALGKYFNSINHKMDEKLEALKEEEKREFQSILDDKIKLLGDLPKTDTCSDIALEMLLLEVLDILSKQILMDNLHQLDERAPILCGINLRNYLAHLSIPYENFNYGDPALTRCIRHNASAINKRIGQFKLFDAQKKTIKAVASKKGNFEDDLHVVDLQDHLFEAIKYFDTERYHCIIQKGAIIQGRNHQNQNILHMCHYNNLLKFYDFGRLDADYIYFIQELSFHIDHYDYDQLHESEFHRMNLKEWFDDSILEKAMHSIKMGEKDKIENEILHYACYAGSLETVKMISESAENYNLNLSGEKGKTLLFHATKFGYIDIFIFLLERIVEIDLTHNLCLNISIENDIDLFKLVIPKCRDVNARVLKDKTILEFAIQTHCHPQIIEYLIEQGADFNARSYYGTICDLAVRAGTVELFKSLIEKGILDIGDFEVLMEVCVHGQTKKLEILLNSKLQKINAGNLFHMCVVVDSPEIINILLSHLSQEFNKDLIIEFVKLATLFKNYKLIELYFDEIKKKYSDDLLSCANEFNDYKIFDMFLKIGEEFKKKIAVKNECGYLHRAVKDGNLVMTKKFIELGFDYETTAGDSSQGGTVLHLAVLADSPTYEVLQYLLTLKGLDVNARDASGCPALFYAVFYNKMAATYLLLKKGADVNLTSNNGFTVMHPACYNGNLELIKMLVHFGAAAQIRVKSRGGESPIDVIPNQKHDHLAEYLNNLQ